VVIVYRASGRPSEGQVRKRPVAAVRPSVEGSIAIAMTTGGLNKCQEVEFLMLIGAWI